MIKSYVAVNFYIFNLKLSEFVTSPIFICFDLADVQGPVFTVVAAAEKIPQIISCLVAEMRVVKG